MRLREEEKEGQRERERAIDVALRKLVIINFIPLIGLCGRCEAGFVERNKLHDGSQSFLIQLL